MLSRLRTAQLIAAGFAAMVVLLVATTAASLVNLARIDDGSREIAESWLTSVKAVGEMNADTQRVRRYQLRMFVEATDEARRKSGEDVAAAKARYDANRKAYEPLITSEEERALVARLDATWERYASDVRNTGHMILGGQEGIARDTLLAGTKLFGELESILGELVALNQRGATAAAEANAAAYAAARNKQIAIALLAAALAVAGALWLSRLIDRALREAIAVTERVAAGDLGARPSARGTADFAALFGALERMVTSLRDTVQQVRLSADSVATASSQIATGNSDLSSRTEEQASAVQETVSNVSQLTQGLGESAESARQAATLATDAAGVASEGGTLIQRVVDTMTSIDEASRRIADITSVVDSIAFQTNILALNAAVEAARAGEQGRGFAVVASEVRSLARRSAEAAREIRGLIGESVQRVEAGTQLVGEAGQTMHRIVESVQRVSGFVAEISATTGEQSTGISEIDQAMARLEQMTQQNAALVEQSAAAAENLRHQAAALNETMARFRVDVHA